MDTNGSVFEAAREAVADELRSRRARRRLTQLELANAAGISRATLARLEAAEKDLTFPDLIKLTAILDTTPAEFLQAVQDEMSRKPV